MPLTVENVIFWVSFSSRFTHVLLGRETKTNQSFSSEKIFLFCDNLNQLR